MRVGIGYDIHRLVKGRTFILGGVLIPHIVGPEAHSDGDALLHAICDAILGAAGLEDLGSQFPVSDDKFKGISSIKLLEKVVSMIKEKDLRVECLDSVVILEEPKITSFKAAMKDKIREALGIEKDKIGIKATTQEGIGAIGRGEAVSAYAVVCLK